MQPESPSVTFRDVVGGFRLAVFAALGFSLVINLLALVPAIYMLQLYDRVIVSRSTGTLIALTLIAIALIGLMGILEWVRSRLLIRLGNQFDLRFSERVVRAFFGRSRAQNEGAASQPIKDLNQVRQFLTGPAISFFDLPWIPFFLLAVFLLHPTLGLVASLGMLFSIVLSALTARLSDPLLADAQHQSLRSDAYISERLANPAVVQSMGMLSNIVGRWREMHWKTLSLQSQASDRAAILQAASRGVRVCVQSMMLAAGAWLVVRGDISPGAMIAGSIVAGRALGPLDQVIASWRQWAGVRLAWIRVAKLISEPIEAPRSVQLPIPNGPLVVTDLTATAPGNQKKVLLSNVSFAVSPGEILAVIGPSAAGKSTLARCLVGVWLGASGSVRLDGAEFSAWDPNALGTHIGYLPQDIALNDATVAENIARFGALESSHIVQAARVAGVHEMILNLPSAYDTRVGTAGGVLTGGQRQRVALARAMYKLPALIVLDEPNSNLDEAGDLALAQALRTMRAEGKIVIVMTHRRSVLALADRALLLDQGSVAAFGTPESMQLVLAQRQSAAAGN